MHNMKFQNEEQLTDFTVGQVQAIIRIIFPTKAKTTYQGVQAMG